MKNEVFNTHAKLDSCSKIALLQNTSYTEEDVDPLFEKAYTQMIFILDKFYKYVPEIQNVLEQNHANPEFKTRFYKDSLYAMVMVAFLNGCCEGMEKNEGLKESSKNRAETSLKYVATENGQTLIVSEQKLGTKIIDPDLRDALDESQNKVNSSINYGDRSQFVITSSYVVGCLWRGEKVSDIEIETMVESLGDYKSYFNPSVEEKEVQDFIDECESELLERASERKENQNNKKNLKVFFDNLRLIERKYGFHPVELIINKVFEQY